MLSSPKLKWQFPRKTIELDSPSRKDGITLKQENSSRRLALAFCQDVGFMLKMNQYTIATGITYWQRFYLYQSLGKNDAYLIATACLLLAGKVEENFKSLQKITEVAYYVRHKKEPAAAERMKKDQKLLLSEMDRVTKAEETLLVTLDFDFSTSHPHGPLWKVIKELGLNTKGDKAKEHFCQIAWNFSNDSLRTTLCIQPYTSTDIAIACINLAATAVHYSLPVAQNNKPWWFKFGTTKESLKDIERQVMSLYKKRDGDSSMTSGLSAPTKSALPAKPVLGSSSLIKSKEAQSMSGISVGFASHSEPVANSDSVSSKRLRGEDDSAFQVSTKLAKVGDLVESRERVENSNIVSSRNEGDDENSKKNQNGDGRELSKSFEQLSQVAQIVSLDEKLTPGMEIQEEVEMDLDESDPVPRHSSTTRENENMVSIGTEIKT